MKKIMVHVVAALVVALMLALTSLHAEQNRLQFEIMDKDRAVIVLKREYELTYLFRAAINFPA